MFAAPAAAVASDFDYLQGAGKFDKASDLDNPNWHKILEDQYSTFTVNEEEKYLQLTKKDYCTEEKSFNDKECAKGYFDDGWVYKWVEGIKPRHIHFEVKMSAGSNQLETCGVHFYNLESDPKNTEIELSTYKDKWVTGPKGPNGFARSPNADVFLFRLGYFEHMKLNVNSMVKET